MTKQGRSPFKGNGGRPTAKSNSPEDKSEQAKKKSDRKYYVGSAKQAADYDKNTEYHLNELQTTLKDASEVIASLRALTKFDIDTLRPVMKPPTKTTDAEKALELEELRIQYQAEMEDFMTTKRHFKTNWANAYGYLWQQCSTGMQTKIRARTEFESKIRDDPIELLKVIKEHALNFQPNRLDVSIMRDSINNLNGVWQRENESVPDYTGRMKSAGDMFVEQNGGSINFKSIVVKDPKYDAKDPKVVKQCEEAAFKRYCAFILIEQADKERFGTLQKLLQSQYAMGKDQYPKTLATAGQLLSSHVGDNVGKKKKAIQGNHRGNQSQKYQPQIDMSPELTFLQADEGRCHVCGKLGHKKDKC